MKKYLSLILAVIMIFSVNICSFAAMQNEADIMVLLGELEIMAGDPNGDLRLNDYVTRAEFSKVAVAASNFKNSVATALRVSPFSDVTYKHWAAPYVQVAVVNGICEGYTDSTFKPDNHVTLEEAVTMLLRILGYTDDDFGISWPYGQIGMANNLKITENVDAVVGDKLTRSQVATLVYNTLDTKLKSSQSKLISIFDCTLVEDVTLVSTKNENSSISSGKIYTSNGTYNIDSDFNYSHVGKKGDLYVKNGNDIICFVPDEDAGQNLESYNVYQVLDKAVVVYKGNVRMELEIDDSTELYNETVKTTYGAFKSQIEMGDILYVKKKSDNTVDYVSYKKGTVVGPKMVANSSWISSFVSDTSNVSVMRNGVASSISAIQTYDIVYYLSDLNIILAYNNKITGIYESATPNKDSPSSITVSGISYAIEGTHAFNKLSSMGTFKYGDTVTLLLGKDNKVADVVSPDKLSGSETIVGCVTGYGTKQLVKPDTTSYTGYYIRLVRPDGNEYEYVAHKNYEAMYNSIVSLDFTDGVAKATAVNSTYQKGGKFSWSDKTLGDYKLSSDLKILDLATTQKTKKATFTSVFPQRIDGLSLSGKILYMKKNSKDEITEIILNDVTGDAYTYALVTEVTKNQSSSITSNFRYDINGNTNMYSGATSFSGLYEGVPVAMLYTASGSLDYAKPLNRVDSSISSFDATTVVAGASTYMVSDKVVVYKRDYNYNYTLSNITDINLKDYSVSAYYDRSSQNGGRIRVIIAAEK